MSHCADSIGFTRARHRRSRAIAACIPNCDEFRRREQGRHGHERSALPPANGRTQSPVGLPVHSFRLRGKWLGEAKAGPQAHPDPPGPSDAAKPADAPSHSPWRIVFTRAAEVSPVTDLWTRKRKNPASKRGQVSKGRKTGGMSASGSSRRRPRSPRQPQREPRRSPPRRAPNRRAQACGRMRERNGKTLPFVFKSEDAVHADESSTHHAGAGPVAGLGSYLNQVLVLFLQARSREPVTEPTQNPASDPLPACAFQRG